MNREGIDQPFHVVGSTNRDLRCVRVPEQVVAEFMRKVEPTSAGIYAAIHQRNAYASDLDVCRITARLT